MTFAAGTFALEGILCQIQRHYRKGLW